MLTGSIRQGVVRYAIDCPSLALAPSTSAGLDSTFRRLREFQREWTRSSGISLSTGDAVVLWLSYKLQSEQILLSSALQYLQNLKSATRRAGDPIGHLQAVKDLERASKRQGAKRPTRQAKPALPGNVDDILRNEIIRPEVRLGVALAWAGAARCADIVYLRAGDVRNVDDGFAVNWVVTKSDPFRLGRTTGVVLVDKWRAMLQQRLQASAPKDQLFPDLSWRLMDGAMKTLGSKLGGDSRVTRSGEGRFCESWRCPAIRM